MASTTNGTNGLHGVADAPNNGVELPYVDALIVGAGPAGASLACFLSFYGIKGIVVGMTSTTADTPRAHITNMAALECLRDIGLDKSCIDAATHGDSMLHTRWCHSMAGREYGRIYSWGNDPKRKGEYDRASPCDPVDLPQTLLEPILVQHAAMNGFQVRFDTQFLSFIDNGDSITTNLFDKLSGQTYQVRSKYLFGADGARSEVIRQLQLPLIKKPNQGLAINVLVKADLSHLMENRMGNLHWIMQPDVEHPDFGWIAIARMVKPWKEWMFIIFPSLTAGTSFTPTEAEYLKRVRDFIGDDTPAEIVNVSKWFINETVAEYYSKGNVFCLGDAVHRHPPFNGLGSNTCIQDAFNLAWKVAYVEQGKASPAILETYSSERQPVGESIITRANQGFREHFNVWNALGLLPPTVAERMKLFNELEENSEAGKTRRHQLREAIKQTAHEFHGLGIEMNQYYQSAAIYSKEDPGTNELESLEDKVLHYIPSTFPGRRLPHVWLNTAIPSTLTSNIDLAGKGAFSVFTGIGGNNWRLAAKSVTEALGVPVKVYSIGFGQDYEDVYFDWEAVRGVEESGCVLVRPDRFVAWRAPKMLEGDGWATEKLTAVMNTILGR